MKIRDLLAAESIELNGKVTGKKETLDAMVDLMAKSGKINDVEVYRKGVYAREEESTTGIGEGIAIPHCKSDSVSRPGLAAMVVPEGVDFDSLDGEKVNLIFLIAAPNTKENVHLDVLSKLSVLLMDEDFTANLRNAKTVDEFLHVIDAAEAEKDAEEEKKEEEQPEVQLTPEEQKVVDDFAEKIDITSSALVMQYGSGAQKKIANFSDTALANVRTKDLGEVGDEIANLVVELKSFDAGEEEKGFLGFFKKQANRLDGMKARYDKAEVNVNKIASSLEGHQVQLMKDIVMLDKLYETNLAYHKELSMYILAGKKRLKRERETTLEELKAKAQRSGLPEDAQAANDFAQQCDSFEKKLHDLELTRMVSVQMSPQIRLVQNNDRLMAEKIQSTIVNTIPLWKSQMVLALGVAHSADAVRAQREVTDMTNELLRKNAEKLKMSTIETARESERGIVDMETLRQTNQSLISTLDEVVKIQEEGKTRRREAEQELGRLENELKQKLLDIRA